MKLVGTCVLILLSLSTENTPSHSVISRFTSQPYRRFHFKNVRRSIKEKKFIWSGYGSKIKGLFLEAISLVEKNSLDHHIV